MTTTWLLPGRTPSSCSDPSEAPPACALRACDRSMDRWDLAGVCEYLLLYEFFYYLYGKRKSATIKKHGDFCDVSKGPMWRPTGVSLTTPCGVRFSRRFKRSDTRTVRYKDHGTTSPRLLDMYACVHELLARRYGYTAVPPIQVTSVIRTSYYYYCRKVTVKLSRVLL